jgi:hypothetical protein
MELHYTYPIISLYHCYYESYYTYNIFRKIVNSELSGNGRCLRYRRDV